MKQVIFLHYYIYIWFQNKIDERNNENKGTELFHMQIR